MKEDLKYIARRKKLVEELRSKGITDEATLKAIGNVPRQQFMDATLLDFAYIDKAYPIGAGQTISQPYTVARQTELLSLKPMDKVLEIGTGSGYQAAVLSECGVEVYTIERQSELFETTHQRLNALGYKVHCIFGDGFNGFPDKEPFDKIIITAGAPVIPKELLGQLKIGGLMVIPLGEGSTQQMMRIKRLSKTDYESKSFGAYSFVPMLNGII